MSGKLERRFAAVGSISAAIAVLSLFLLLSLSSETRPPALPQGWTLHAADLQVQDILFDGDITMVAAIQGLVALSPDGNEQHRFMGERRIDPFLRAIVKDPMGHTWVARESGVSRLTKDSETALPRADGKAPGAMRALALDRNGRLWAGGDAGLFRVDADALIPVPLPRPDTLVTALLFDLEGGLWIGTAQQGVLRLKDGHFRSWSVADGLQHPQVTCFFLERDGSVWSGQGFYNKGGAVRFVRDAARWRIGDSLPLEQLAGPKVRSLYRGRKGRLWVGHEYDGLTLRDQGRTVRTLTVDDGLPDAEVTVIEEDRAGNLWLGTLRGALRLTPGAVERLLGQHSGERHGT
ncbi:ligand-binding sensor domain-containing protein [Thiorhodococcus minor]|uniref:Transcriptional regulator n=1 Tax=Thiorhodococcus minor TaxID=57489 RepID=A0A6M0JUF8_9GAMM|nr:two-component regulator propeller domain-containing protein [Thiorhodococcus minor]NEV61162.1 hypothetical protein [Thiorhodococcus minor]